jgi:hypothetical protein
MGCGFPKEFREAAVEAEPKKFSLPPESDMRFNWIHVNLDAIDYEEMRDLIENAWSNCVPKYVAPAYAEPQGYLWRRRGRSRGATPLLRRLVARLDNKAWSLYGAPWLQPVATQGKSARPVSRENKPNPLPPAATGCLRRSMVRVHSL